MPQATYPLEAYSQEYKHSERDQGRSGIERSGSEGTVLSLAARTRTSLIGRIRNEVRLPEHQRGAHIAADGLSKLQGSVVGRISNPRGCNGLSNDSPR
jgi:hypothetical protein